jgi:DNA-binding XRE family transcriptional regulator/tetratricopeptide (TPR) repeat protein
VTKRRTALAAARKAAGYTQEGLAAVLHIERSTVIRWEAGRHAPVPYLWPKLAHVLGISRDQLTALLTNDLTPPAACSPPDSQAVAWEDMRRRTVLKWGVAATAASLSTGVRTTVGMADVKRLHRAAARLHSLDQQHGGDSLWQSALAEAGTGMQLLEYGTYTGSVGEHLLSAAGQLQICAGWLALDAGQHGIARSCFSKALAMSRQAADAQIETRALANLAYQSTVLARPREAVRYATGAEQAATGRGSTILLTVIPQLRLAVGNALAGNAREANRALGTARRALERNTEATTEAWSAFLSPMEIDGIEATCALALHRPVHAERLLEHTIAGYATQLARNLAGWRVRLARARLDLGAVDGAAEAAHRALDDLTGGVASWRVLSELDAVAHRLKAYPDVAEVERFLVRHQAVHQ